MQISSSSHSDSFSHKSHVPEAGFSLVELLVTVSIIALISTVLAVRFASFDSVTLLNNLSYELALSVREAQVFSLSVRGQGSDFDELYGIYAQSGTSEYLLFRDASGNLRYDSGEEVQTNNISQRFVISNICYEAGGAGACTVGGNGTETCGGNVSVGFKRPSFEPVLYRNGSPVATFSVVRFKLMAANDSSEVRCVEVGTTGQISVVNP